jgi:hypothetical protein
MALMGQQKIKIGRIRKTDPLYRVKVFANTATMPKWTTLSGMIPLGSNPLPTNLMTHTHQMRTNEKSSLTWTQNSTNNAGHNHEVSVVFSSMFPQGKLTVLPVLGHTNNIL